MRSFRSVLCASLVLPLAAGLAACGDDPTGVDLLADLDPVGLQAAIQQDFAGFQASATARYVVDAAMDTIATYQGVQLAPAPRIERSSPLDARASLAPAVALASVTSFGDAAGKTFVFDPQIGRWREAPDLTGAPTNGVRILWYSVNSLGQVLVPLTALGYVDLTEASQDTAGLVRVEVVSTGAGELADYVESHTVIEGASTWTETFRVTGSVMYGSDVMEFDMRGDGSGEMDTDSSTSHIAIDFQAGDRSYAFDVTETFAADGIAFIDDLTMDATRDGKVTELTLGLQGDDAGNTGTGALSHAGDKVANMTVTDNAFTFTKPDGGAYGTSDSQDLERLVAIMLFGGSLPLLTIPLVN